MKKVKAVYFSVAAALLTMIGYLMNVLETIRLALLNVVSLMGYLVYLFVGYLAVGSVFGFLFAEGTIVSKLGEFAGLVLIIVIVYYVLNFVVALVQVLLSLVLGFLNFGKITEGCVYLLWKVLHGFSNLLDEDDYYKGTFHWLFMLPRFLQKLTYLAEKISAVVQVVLYPLFGGTACYWAYLWTFGSSDAATFRTIDVIWSICSIVIFVCIAIGLAYCLSAAVTSAAESTREMNELLTNYYMYFVNISEDDTYTSDTFGSESQHECKDDAQSVHNTASENPYYVILGKADSLVELKKLYRQLAPQIHPDTTEQYSTEEATHQFTLLNEAYTYWKDWFNRQN